MHNPFEKHKDYEHDKVQGKWIMPEVKLNNKVKIPQIGFGVYKIDDAEAAEVIGWAFEAGYRSIDTASVYGNEKGVGQAIVDSGLAREEVFVTSKLWNDEQGYDESLRAFDSSMDKLGLDYLDLYLIHWPNPDQQKYVDSWKALEKLYSDGRVRAIGVSNFLPANLEVLANECDVKPVLNQIEYHPALQQNEIAHYCFENNIAIEAWSPLARGEVFDSPVLAEIAEWHDKTPAQVILRWHLQQGRIIIPKSSNQQRIQENIDILDFELNLEAMENISALEAGMRIGPDPASYQR